MPNAQDGFKLIVGGAGNGGTAPTTQTYKDIGVTGVDAGNIASINDALKGLPGANKDTAAEVQGIVDAYRKVLAAADAVAGNTDAANLPSLAEYGKIGVSEVTTITQAALLGSVIDGKNKIDADTVSEIKALALASNAVLEAAASANGASLSMAQLEQLGIKGVTADNLAAVRQAIANSADDGSAIDSLTKLQSVVSATTTQVASVLTGLQSYNGANGQSAPTTQTYKDIGVTGVDAGNIASINDALKGLPGANKDTAAEVQGIVDAYRKVLAAADAVAGNTDAANLPSLAEYGKIGVSEVTTITQAALLGSVIDGKNKIDADTVSEIKALALASNAVLEAAASANGASLSMAQLEQLGIKGVTADNLAAVRQAIANSADDGSAIDSLTKLQSVVSATTTQVASVLTGLQSYNGANGQSAPTTQTYKDIGVTGVDAGNIASINDALKGLPGANKDTAAEVQGIVDAYRKVLAAADAVAGNTDAANLPSLAEYGKIGVSEVTTITQAALLGSVIDGKNKIDADTVSEIKALALASNAVLEAAASANGASLSMAQLEQLGIKGVTADNLAAVRQAIANSADDGSAIDSLTKLQSVVSATTTQVASVLTGLQSYNGANGQSAPTTQTYKDIGVTGVDAGNIASINDALKGLPGANKDTAAEVQGIVDAYRKVLAAADAVAGNTDAANLPSLAEYGKIGVSEVTTITQAALLGSVIDGKNKIDADTVSEIKALALASNAVLEAAASANGASLSMAQLEQLGIKGVTADNLAVVRQAIANSADDGSAIDSLTKLQSVVSATTTQVASVLTGLQSYNGANGQSAPTTQTYKDIGVTGVDAGNIASINDALKGLPGANKDTAAEVQGIVDAYRKVLAAADAVAGNTDAANLPSLAEYGKIGVSEVTTITQAALLGSVIDGKNKIDADTVSEIKALALASNAVLEAAASANGASLSMAQLEQLGIKGVTADNLAVVRQAIANSADDGSAIDSLTKLQSVVSATTTQVASVLTGLQSYNGANGQSAPTTQTYKDIGVTGVDAGNIASINDALKGLPGANKDTAAEVQGIVDAYRKVLAAADAVAGNTDAANLPSLAEYGKIGVSEVTTITQAALLGSVIDGKNKIDADTVSEIKALALASNAVLEAAASANGASLSMAQLEQLGIKGVTADNLAVVRQAIANSADDGSAINSLSKLQTLVSGAAFSPSDVQLSNDTGSFSTDFVTTVNNQTISAKLSTVISAGDTLEGSVNSGATWEKINSMVTDRAITWTGVTLNSGVNNIVFRLTKQDGSQYLSSAQTYTLDNTAPAAPTLVLDAASDTGISNSDRVTNNNTPTISGTAESGSSVKLYDGSTQVGSATTGGDGKWSITPGSALVNGTHTLTVKATDAAGNESAASSLNVTIDKESPRLSSNTPVDDATDVGISANLTLSFSENIALGSGNITLKAIDGAADVVIDVASHSNQLSISGNTLTINPSSDLARGKQYAVQIGNTAITDTAGNTYAGISDLNTLNFTTSNSQPGDASISLGSMGKLIAPIQVEGNWYYFYDKSGNGVADSADAISLEQLAINLGTIASAITESNRTFTINGVTVKLPTYGGPVGVDGKPTSFGAKNGTSYSANPLVSGDNLNDPTPNGNATYNDYLAIWDGINGSGTGTGQYGVPAGWLPIVNYWSATPSPNGHAMVNLGAGMYGGEVVAWTDNFTAYFAFQVL
ncbi:Ig-like domain-containing protein [Rhodoferax sp. TBRC 17198]|uniref:Ig-like domain-containing protein n=1 Tax=Rhodoferax potami TaxID=3068338 RepID=UPI0028BF1FD4|nr:Ig-like domain-containing protein [Rhodoferax sp. TBRC 17198]MDT7524485.1 Ig-like domain-containing protein [Rhodoferax sp. TBRC 17198]